MIIRRRFADVVARQLDAFAADEQDDLLADVHAAKVEYDRAERDGAEQAYGDYVDAIDAVKDALAEMRDRFASTLDDDGARVEYQETFERVTRRRWRWLG